MSEEAPPSPTSYDPWASAHGTNDVPAQDPAHIPTAVPTLVTRLRSAGCVFAEDEAAVLETAEPDPERREALVVRRIAGEPLEYVVGWADFDGHRVLLEPGVFIPRQRTALLVELAAAHLDTTDTTADMAAAPAVAVDLCCGSGALGLALAHRHPDLRLHATDVDPVAVACATRNLAPVGGATHCGDLDAALPRDLAGRVDALLANVPYVPTAGVALMPADSRDHEPRGTVDGGADGLDLLRRVAAVAPRWLRPGGLLLCEVGDDQVPAALDAFAAAGLAGAAHVDDERGATAVTGRA